MLPLVLLFWERRWRWRLAPFFALSLLLGCQALWLQHGQADTAYTLHFTPAAIAVCLRFYLSRVFLLPWAGLAVFAVGLWVRDPRYWFGATTFAALLGPMLVLPGRLFGAYLYVPLIGVAVCVAFLAGRANKGVVLALLAVWLGWNYRWMRVERRTELASADDRRAWVTQAQAVADTHPEVKTFAIQGGPLTLAGERGALVLASSGADVRPYEEANLHASQLAVLTWVPREKRVGSAVRVPGAEPLPYLSFGPETPVWQLGAGWGPVDGWYCWVEPEGAAELTRPPGAKTFDLSVNVGKELLAAVGKSKVEVWLGDQALTPVVFPETGVHSASWPVAAGESGLVQVRIRASPPYPGPKPLGIAVAGFGFR